MAGKTPSDRPSGRFTERIYNMTDRIAARISSRPSKEFPCISTFEVRRMLMDQDPAERAKGLTLMIGDEEGLMKLAISHARLDIRLEAVRFLQHRSSLAYVIMETKCSETRDIAIELQSKMA